jgi:hypothetical protein
MTNKPFWMVTATGKQGTTFTKQVYIYYFPNGEKELKYKLVCLRYCLDNAGFLYVDASNSIHFKRRKDAMGWQQIPAELMMEFFLLLFEKELQPGEIYEGKKWYAATQ